MPKKLRKPIKKEGKVLKPENLIISDIVLHNVDRTPKDVGTLKTALSSAENVHYPNRSRYYDLLETVILDGHLYGVLNKRISAVRNKRLVYKNRKGKKIDEMDGPIGTKEFRNIITWINEARAFGTSGMEFMPGETIKPVFIPRKHIKPEFGVIAINQTDYEGFDYNKIPNIWVIGEQRDLGYLLQCSFYVLIKRGNFSDWAQYVEIFGQPMRVIRYDAYDDKTKIELKQVLDESGSSLALMIPKQAEFDVMDGKTSNGNGELQEKLKQACNDEISIIILGNTETTGSSRSSGYAQAKEHGRQQMEITKDDLAYTLNWLNDEKFISILKSYNLPVVPGGYFEYEKEIDVAALTEKIAIDTQVANHVPIAPDYWYDTYGVTKPDNFEELMQQKEAQKQVNELEHDADNASDAPGKQSKLFAARKWIADFFDPAP